MASSPSEIPLSATALLVIDVQKGISAPSPFFGQTRSNPHVHENIRRSQPHSDSRSLPPAATVPETKEAQREAGNDVGSSPVPPVDQKRAGPHIIHVCHHSTSADSPLHPSQPGVAFEAYAAPWDGEPVFSKSVNSAFIGTGLEILVREKGIRRLVVAGLTTDHCVSTTVRMAANLRVVGEGGEVVLVGDATAAHEKRLALGPGRGEVVDAETVQSVHLASLNGEFCRVVSTEEALAEMRSWPGYQ